MDPVNVDDVETIELTSSSTDDASPEAACSCSTKAPSPYGPAT
jgi:hypothetical protein